ncbi:MAG: alanine dehydrogenase [Pseudomonadota bacterium]
MRIGIPREIKTREGRVALIPAAVAELVRAGHEVFIEAGAGQASGYPDADFREAGALLLDGAAAVFERAQLIVKVKEPLPDEVERLRPGHILFSFLHLAALPDLARRLQAKGVTAIAFETVEEGGRLPLLAPMSDIAGRLSIHIGTTLLHGYHGGRGLMLGGMPSTERGNVVILGAGNAGGNAVAVAAALGAQVTVFAPHREALERMYRLGPNVTALPPYAAQIEEAVRQADLLIGAVLIPGASAPKLVTTAMVKRMKPGSVIIDISVDQGGCIETTRPTDYENPTYIEHGVVHFGVTNMPGAVPRTATQALSTVLTPYILRLTAPGGLEDPAIAHGINIADGRIVHPAVAQALAG